MSAYSDGLPAAGDRLLFESSGNQPRGVSTESLLGDGMTIREGQHFAPGGTFAVDPNNPDHRSLKVLGAGSNADQLTASMVVDLDPGNPAWGDRLGASARVFVEKADQSAHVVTVRGSGDDGLGERPLRVRDQWLSAERASADIGPGPNGERFVFTGGGTATQQALRELMATGAAEVPEPDASSAILLYGEDGAFLGKTSLAALVPLETFLLAVGDETTDLSTGTAKATFRTPYAFALSAVRASVSTAPTGAAIIVDVNRAGTSILSTRLSIDAGEKTSATAASQVVLAEPNLAEDAEVTVDVDQVGSTAAGRGLKVSLIGRRLLGGLPPPVAVDDAFDVTEDAVAVELDVLANDLHLTGRTITVAQPARGTVAVINNGTATAKVTWTDDGAGGGATSFAYSVDGSNNGLVNLEIEALPSGVTMPSLIFPTGAYFTPPGDHEPNRAVNLTPSYAGSDVAADDLILGVVGIHDPHASAPTPSCATPGGFTSVASVGATTNLFGQLFRKFAVGSEDGTTEAFDWNSSDAAGDIAIATLLQFRGVDTTTPVESVSTASGTLTNPGLPTVSTTQANSLAVCIQVYSDNITTGSPPVPSGATGGTWQLAAFYRDITTGDDVGMAVFTAEMPSPGTISGGSVAFTPTSPTRQLSRTIGFALRGSSGGGPPPPTGLFLAPNGSDTTGDGTVANPWKTLAKGMREVSAGGRLNLRGGTYRLTSGFPWTKSGTSGSPIIVASYPGEVAVITADFAQFQEIGNTAWELHDAATETWRSVAFPVSEKNLLSFVANGQLYRLPEYLERSWLMSMNYQYRTDNVYYRGPGYCRHTDGRFYVRLQNLSGSRGAGVPSDYEPDIAIGDAKNTPPSSGGFDPRTFRINVSTVADLFTITAAHVNFERVAFEGSDRTIVLSGASHITFDRCRIQGGRECFRFAPNNHHITVRHCFADTGVPPWISWNEVKTSKADFNPGLKLSFSTIDENNDDILIEENHIRSCFDGMAETRGTCNNIKWIRNTFDYLVDDLVQFNGNTTNLEVAYNYVNGPGPGYNPGNASAVDKWFHHNVLDIWRGYFNWRLGMESSNGGGQAWQNSHDPFPTHNMSGSNVAAKIYANTILYRLMANNDGSRIERQGGVQSSLLHEALNNIAVGKGSQCYIRGATSSTARQFLDHNVMFDVTGYTINWGRDFPGGSYASLAAWKASANFNGWEQNSKQVDPQFADQPNRDFRPLNTAVHTGAKPLASTGWPGATNDPWFGAVDPNASTGLGNVGIPPGTQIGP